MPTVSVIVPVYKVEKYIYRCVDSILGQTFSDFELVLVDDGSPDRCPAICDEYAAKDPRVHVIHQENGGLSAARNAGIDWAFANSNSQWISLIDSDDWVHPEYLEQLLVGATQTELPICICGYAETGGEDPIVIPEQLTLETWRTENFFTQHNVNAVVAWGKLYRKDLFKNIRYPLGKVHEDEFITHRLLFQSDTLAVIPAPLYCYYQNPEGITKVPWNPTRLHALEALEERIAYFQAYGNKTLYDWSLQLFFSHHAYLYDTVLTLEDRKLAHHCRRTLVKSSRRVLLQYRKDLPVSRYKSSYVIAFPWLITFYRFMKKLFRIGK